MPVQEYCNKCAKPIDSSCIPWLPAYDGLCHDCRRKVGEKIRKAVDEFESSLRSDGVNEWRIKGLSRKFFDELANEE